MKKNIIHNLILLLIVITIMFSPRLVLANEEHVQNIDEMEKITYLKLSNNQVVIEYEKGKTISKITIDNNDFDKENYTLSDNEIIIKEGTLEKGTHVVNIIYDNQEIVSTNIEVYEEEIATYSKEIIDTEDTNKDIQNNSIEESEKATNEDISNNKATVVMNNEQQTNIESNTNLANNEENNNIDNNQIIPLLTLTNTNEEVINDNNDIEPIVESIPEYFFVETLEIEAFDQKTIDEIKNKIIEILEENNIDINSFNYNLDVNINELNHIYEAIIKFTSKDDLENNYEIKRQIIYSNSDNYNESDNNTVKDFINNNELSYVIFYSYGDNLDIDEYDLNKVKNYIEEKLNNTNIKFVFKPIGTTKDGFVGNVFLFINNKYYGVTGIIINNGIKIIIPHNVDDIGTYILNKIKENYNIDNDSVYENDYIKTNTRTLLKIEYLKDEPIIYIVKKDNNLVYEKLSNKDFTITFDKELDEVLLISLNNIEIPKDYYSINSNNITISNKYLDTFTNKKYNFHIETLLGYANDILTIIPKQYIYLEGANAVIVKDKDLPLSVRINAEINKFLKVSINGKELDTKYYKIRNGSTIIDIDSKYLDSLEPGKYELKALFIDGEAITCFTIKEYLIMDKKLEFEKGSYKNLYVNLNEINSIKSILIDNKVISSSYYTINGKTISILSKLLETLSNKEHNLIINFIDGTISTKFNVYEKVKEAKQIITPVKRYYTKRTVKNNNYNTEEKVSTNDTNNEMVEVDTKVEIERGEELEEAIKDIGKIKEIPIIEKIKTKKKTKNIGTIPKNILFIAIICVLATGIIFTIYKKNSDDEYKVK